MERVDAAGGQVEITTAPGEGTVVEIAQPLWPGTSGQPSWRSRLTAALISDEVGERLGEVAELLAGRADLLGVEAEVVGVGEHLLEGEPGLVEPARRG